MKRAFFWGLAGLAALAVALFLTPGPIDPVAWSPPKDAGLSGAFAANEDLRAAERIEIGGHEGPEDVAEGPDGALYAATQSGVIVRISADGAVSEVVDTGGRPLGIDFGPDGALYIADAYRGLMRFGDGQLEELVATVDGAPLKYANSVAAARNGDVYFTQSTQRVDPEALGSTLDASVLDLAEHRTTGRLFKWSKASETVEKVADGFSFANGVALSVDESYAVVAETGAYSLWRVALDGPERGAKTLLIGNLPAFPDNVKREPGKDVFWIGMGSLRNPLADAFAGAPSVRGLLFKLPKMLHPGPKPHGIVFSMDGGGAMRSVLQDPEGALGFVSGASPIGDRLVVAFLKGGFLYHIPLKVAEAAGSSVR